jgi:hypothetical protein
LTTAQADQVVALTALDREIDSYAYAPQSGDCDEQARERSRLRQMVENRNLRFYFSLTYAGRETYDRLDHLIERDTYSGFVLSRELEGLSPSPSRNLNSLISEYSTHTKESLDGLSPLERARALDGYIQNRYNLSVPRDLLIEETLRQAMINSPNQWREATQGLKDELNFEQKMRIAARMGNTFLGNYNYSRAGTSDGKAVTIEQLLTAAKNNTEGGVCRDVSFAQSQILQELGVPKDKIYIIAYATPSSYHSVIAVQDPNNPDNLVKLNYGEMTQDDRNTGPEALRQYTSLPDVGIAYRIFDADAKPVGRIPTELGLILRDVTNATPSLIQTRPYNLARVGASSDLGSFNLFTGTTSSGDHLVGAAFDTTIRHSNRQLTEVGVALVQQDINSPTVSLRQDLLYARVKSEFSTSDMRIGGMSLRGEAGAEAEVLYGRHDGQRLSDGREIKGNTFDLSGSIFAGVSSSYETAGGSTITGRVRGYFYPDFANETEAKRMTLVHDRTEASVGFATDLSPKTRALAETGIVIRQYGEAAFVRGALEGIGSTDYHAFASYSTPLSRDTPSFMPERDRLMTIGGGRAMSSGWTVNMSFERSLDRNENRGTFNVERRF